MCALSAKNELMNGIPKPRKWVISLKGVNGNMNAYIFIVLLILMAISGCGKDKERESKVEMPEVNDENCTSKSIKALPSNIQQDFSARCLRRSSYKESSDREW